MDEEDRKLIAWFQKHIPPDDIYAAAAQNYASARLLLLIIMTELKPEIMETYTTLQTHIDNISTVAIAVASDLHVTISNFENNV